MDKKPKSLPKNEAKKNLSMRLKEEDRERIERIRAALTNKGRDVPDIAEVVRAALRIADSELNP